MISIAVVSGLAGVWLWTVLNDEEGIFAWVAILANRTSITRKWLTCPWCSGAWFAGGFALILGVTTGWESNPIGLGVIAIAAAGITGLIGSYLNGGD